MSFVMSNEDHFIVTHNVLMFNINAKYCKNNIKFYFKCVNL